MIRAVERASIAEAPHPLLFLVSYSITVHDIKTGINSPRIAKPVFDRFQLVVGECVSNESSQSVFPEVILQA